MNLVKNIKINGCFYFQRNIYIKKSATLVCEIDSMEKKTEIRRVDINYFDDEKEIYPILEKMEKEEEKNFYVLENYPENKSVILCLTNKESDMMCEIAEKLDLNFCDLIEFEDVIEFN